MPMVNKPFAVATVLLVTAFAPAQSTTPNTRPRASDLGLKVGILPTGPLNAITDVAGVEVGQTTIIRGDDIRTGVTAVLPHSGNLYREKVPGAIFVGNGFGKLAGSTQVDEMGDIETPILLTSTTSVPRANGTSTCSAFIRQWDLPFGGVAQLLTFVALAPPYRSERFSLPPHYPLLVRMQFVRHARHLEFSTAR